MTNQGNYQTDDPKNDHLEEAKRLVLEYDKYPESSEPSDPLDEVSFVLSSIAHALIDIAESLRKMNDSKR